MGNRGWDGMGWGGTNPYVKGRIQKLFDCFFEEIVLRFCLVFFACLGWVREL